MHLVHVNLYFKVSSLLPATMRILIDFTQITLRKAGVGVYGEQLLKQIAVLNQENLIYVLIQDDETALDHLPGLTLIKVSAKWFRKLPLRLALEQLYIPRLVRKLDIDVVHSLHYSFPLFMTRARKVVTFHDMSGLLMPEMHSILKRWYLRFFIPLTAKLADRLIFVSEAARTDYLDVYSVPLNKTAVIHHAVSKQFTPNIPEEQLAVVRAKYQISGPYVLFIGTLEPRKNIPRLIEAFAKLTKEFPNERLVIVGMKGWFYDEIFHLTSQLALTERVRFTGFVDEADKPALLCGADLFVYPSLYEGFGIPILEALACGIPTVTSNRSSMPEIAGDGAITVDPTNTGKIHEAMRILLSDDLLRNQIRVRALEQSAKFSWDTSAAATLDQYRRAHDQNS